jgi:hypothetical protein
MTKKDKERTTEDHLNEMARRLCAATISCEMGVSVQTAYNTYTKGKEIPSDSYWFKLARLVSERFKDGDSGPETEYSRN